MPSCFRSHTHPSKKFPLTKQITNDFAFVTFRERAGLSPLVAKTACRELGKIGRD